MQNNSSRQDILQKIAAACIRRPAFIDTPPKIGNPVYRTIQPDAVTCFSNELEAISGQCFLCDDESDLFVQLKLFVKQQGYTSLFCRDTYITHQLQTCEIPFTNQDLDFESMQAGITGCEFLVARTGSVFVSSATTSGRQMNVFPPVHIVIAYVSQLVDYPQDALRAVQLKYGDALPSSITVITGPSRTADIEKTLVLGAHGPKEFVVFLCKV